MNLAKTLPAGNVFAKFTSYTNNVDDYIYLMDETEEEHEEHEEEHDHGGRHDHALLHALHALPLFHPSSRCNHPHYWYKT